MAEIQDSFGFHVHRTASDYHHNRYFVVELPHSCDEWVITGEQVKGAAVAEMERFIAEAQAALAELRALPETDES